MIRQEAFSAGPDNSDAANQERVKDMLSRAFSLEGIGLKHIDHRRGGEMVQVELGSDNAHVRDGSYHAENGIVLIKVKEGFKALPYSPEAVTALDQAGFQNVNMGIPNLNDPEFWYAPNSESFRKWKGMVEAASRPEGVEEADAV